MSTSSLKASQPTATPKSDDPTKFVGDILQAARDGLRPAPRLTVSEWADRHRVLPLSSAEPGRWRTRRVPYMREIMDCLSSYHPAEFVTVMKGSQTGGTDAGNNWIGYTIHHDPGVMMIVFPGLSEVKRNTAERIDPLIESTPELQDLVSRPRSRDSGNSIFRKKFRGGSLVMTGANSAVGLRSTPARKLFLDEVDGYPSDAGGEGDPVDLAVRRTATYGSRRKVYQVSSPTTEGRSRIQKAYGESDQRKWYVPCKGCGVFEVIQWINIEWPEGEPEKAAYVCPHCQHAHQQGDKNWLLEHGEWRASVETNGRHVGFHIPGLLSPFETWGEQARQFLKVKDDPNRLKVFINTVLGEPWKEKGEAPEWERLYERREPYPMGAVPRGGILLTAGVDVQADRLEAEVVAWDRDKRSWSIEYRVMEGDTSKIDDSVWQQLTQLLNDSWPHEAGAQLVLQRMAVDDGFNSQIVREWARHQSPQRVMVVKGRDHATSPVGLPTAVDVNPNGRKRIARGMRVWPVGVSLLKSELYGWLRMGRPTDEELAEGMEYPPGYCHFPEYDAEFFRMLTAEQLVKRTVKGYEKLEWEKTRERNESLDCRMYSRAAAIAVGADRWHDGQWAELEVQILGEAVVAVDAGNTPTPAQQAKAPQQQSRTRRSNWINRLR